MLLPFAVRVKMTELMRTVGLAKLMKFFRTFLGVHTLHGLVILVREKRSTRSKLQDISVKKVHLLTACLVTLFIETPLCVIQQWLLFSEYKGEFLALCCTCPNSDHEFLARFHMKRANTSKAWMTARHNLGFKTSDKNIFRPDDTDST